MISSTCKSYHFLVVGLMLQLTLVLNQSDAALIALPAPSLSPVINSNNHADIKHYVNEITDLKRVSSMSSQRKYSDWPKDSDFNTEESVSIESTVGAPPSLAQLPTATPTPTPTTVNFAARSPTLAHTNNNQITISGHQSLPTNGAQSAEMQAVAIEQQQQQQLQQQQLDNLNEEESGISEYQQQMGQQQQQGISDSLVDLQVAAGHYSPKKSSHHSKYYMYAESHKKGDFDSGYKMGGHKMTISGHSSVHKGHASGHVNWHGKKGKGMHTWEYSHVDKGKKKYHHH